MSRQNQTWLPDEERRLRELKDIHNCTWEQIAPPMNRTPQACASHYDVLKQSQASHLFDWLLKLDETLMQLKAQGLDRHIIADKLQVPVHAVPQRWNELKNQPGLVPDQVVDVWRRKGPVVWTDAEDEYLLSLCNGLHDDEAIFQKAGFLGKSREDVSSRRKKLVYPSGGGQPTALGMALGMSKYPWNTGL